MAWRAGGDTMPRWRGTRVVALGAGAAISWLVLGGSVAAQELPSEPTSAQSAPAPASDDVAQSAPTPAVGSVAQSAPPVAQAEAPVPTDPASVPTGTWDDGSTVAQLAAVAPAPVVFVSAAAPRTSAAAPSAAPAATLPATGASGVLAITAAGLCAGGVVLVASTRRRPA
jgi:LPXTG-motif cell wall-anchored protein